MTDSQFFFWNDIDYQSFLAYTNIVIKMNNGHYYIIILERMIIC